MLWTADTNFDLDKYDYFKIVQPDGTMTASENRDSLHRDDYARGVVKGTTYELELRELGRWETVLRTNLMDTKLRQRFCKIAVKSNGKVETGYALNELGYGTAW